VGHAEEPRVSGTTPCEAPHVRESAANEGGCMCLAAVERKGVSLPSNRNPATPFSQLGAAAVETCFQEGLSAIHATSDLSVGICRHLSMSTSMLLFAVELYVN
jgi:hypothetical protein